MRLLSLCSSVTALLVYLTTPTDAQSGCGTQNPTCGKDHRFAGMVSCCFPSVCYFQDRLGTPGCCPAGSVCRDGVTVDGGGATIEVTVTANAISTTTVAAAADGGGSGVQVITGSTFLQTTPGGLIQQTTTEVVTSAIVTTTMAQETVTSTVGVGGGGGGGVVTIITGTNVIESTIGTTTAMITATNLINADTFTPSAPTFTGTAFTTENGLLVANAGMSRPRPAKTKMNVDVGWPRLAHGLLGRLGFEFGLQVPTSITISISIPWIWTALTATTLLIFMI